MVYKRKSPSRKRSSRRKSPSRRRSRRKSPSRKRRSRRKSPSRRRSRRKSPSRKRRSRRKSPSKRRSRRKSPSRRSPYQRRRSRISYRFAPLLLPAESKPSIPYAPQFVPRPAVGPRLLGKGISGLACGSLSKASCDKSKDQSGRRRCFIGPDGKCTTVGGGVSCDSYAFDDDACRQDPNCMTKDGAFCAPKVVPRLAPPPM